MRYPVNKEEIRLLEEVWPYFDDDKGGKVGDYPGLIDDAPAEIKKNMQDFWKFIKKQKSWKIKFFMKYIDSIKYEL